MKKLLIFMTLALALAQCTPKKDGGCTGNDTTKTDTVTVDTTVAIPDTQAISMQDEMGTVEPMTQSLIPFRETPLAPGLASGPLAVLVNQPYFTKRSLYIDRADDIYKNVTASKKLAKYMKDNNFDEGHIYHFYDIVGSSSNYAAFAVFNKLLYDNGVKVRTAVLGSASTTGFNNFWNYTSDTTKKPNGINFENEFWNYVSGSQTILPYTQWVNAFNTLDRYANSKAPYKISTSFYMGWFKLLDGKTDVQAATQIAQITDWVDLHDYQDGKVSATYGSSRYEAWAKAAQLRGKPIIINPIFSIEQKAWGAKTDFQGYYLKALGYAGMEKKYVDDFNANATTLQKTWLKLGKPKYFMYRYCILAVPPLP